MEFMKISAFADKDFKVPIKDNSGMVINPYPFMINPDTLKLQQTFASAEENGNKPGGKLSFDIVIDCTGIVDAKRTDLPAEMDKIKAILYQYNGKTHHPNFVKMLWGNNLTFYGLLTSLDVNYTLFKPDGTPLRVKMLFVFDQLFPAED